MKISMILITILVMLTGCGNIAARHGYGSMKAELECNRKLINVTWKGENAELWYLTRPFRHDEFAETYRFKASTQFGLLEGEVIISEKKCN